jgi:uncharacterized SAM-binding protein YcdF (DUF218 family)
MTGFFLSIFKAIGGPGSIGFLAVSSAIALLLGRLGPRARRAGRVGLVCLFAVYLFLGLPVVATGFADRVSSYRPVSDITTLTGTDVLVVLDGDNALGRIQEAVRMYRGLTPRHVIVSGRQWFVDEIVEAGVPADRIVADHGPRTTREQVESLPRLLAGRDPRRIVVVASRLQVPRVAALARSAGVTVDLAPSPIDVEPPTAGIWRFVPTYTALRVSRDAIYERWALAYYRYRGWIA